VNSTVAWATVGLQTPRRNRRAYQAWSVSAARLVWPATGLGGFGDRRNRSP